jgi:hypothetical protein
MCRLLGAADDGSPSDQLGAPWRNAPVLRKGATAADPASAHTVSVRRGLPRRQISGAGRSRSDSASITLLSRVTGFRGVSGRERARDIQRGSLELISAVSSLQDGDACDGAGNDATGRLGDQVRCIEDVQHIQGSSVARQVLAVLLAWHERRVGICGMPVRGLASSETYDTHYEDSGSLDSRAWLSLLHLHRRFAGAGPGSVASRAAVGGIASIHAESGIGAQSQEERLRADAGRGFSGDAVSFGAGADGAPSHQTVIDREVDASDRASWFDYHAGASEDSRHHGSGVASNSDSAFSHGCYSEAPSARSEAQLQMGREAPNRLGGFNGADVMGGSTSGFSWSVARQTDSDDGRGGRRLTLRLRWTRGTRPERGHGSLVESGASGVEIVEPSRVDGAAEGDGGQGGEGRASRGSRRGIPFGQRHSYSLRERPGRKDSRVGQHSTRDLDDCVTERDLGTGHLSAGSLPGCSGPNVETEVSASGLDIESNGVQADRSALGRAAGGSVCNSADDPSEAVRELAPRSARCWHGCIHANMEGHGDTAVREPAVFAHQSGPAQARGGEQLDRVVARDTRLAWSGVDAGANPIVHRLAAAARRPGRGNDQQRCFGGDGFEFTRDDVLEALRATLRGRGQTTQAINVSLAGLTQKSSSKESLSEFCDFLAFMLEQPVTEFSVQHVINFAASRLHGERRGRTPMTEAGAVAIFNKVFTWVNAFTDGSFRTPDDHAAVLQFKKGLSLVAKLPKQAITSVPDMTVFLQFLREAPSAADACPDCRRAILSLLFMVSLPMRPDDVRKIVLSQESSVVDGDQVTIRFFARKRQRGFSTPFRIRDPQLVDYLQVYKESTAAMRVQPAPEVSYLIAPIKGPARQLSADTISNFLQRIMTYLRVPAELTPRRLRDMTATALMVATNDIEFVKRAGGWKQAAILQDRYLREVLRVNADVFRSNFALHQGADASDRVVVRAANVATH